MSATLPAWLSARVDDLADRMEKAQPYPFRHPEDQDGMLRLHHNDYLFLAGRPEVRQAKMESIRRWHDGAARGSLVYNFDSQDGDHARFRTCLAASMQARSVVLATSGWAANVGLIQALARKDLPVYLDSRAHASLWDGARLAGARIGVVRHQDPEFLRRKMRRDGSGIVCIDAFYSNSGGVCSLEDWVDVCQEQGGLLILDEAHSLAMVGDQAGGWAVECGLADRIPFRTASLSKALGGHGGIVACSEEMARFLVHQAHSLVFSSSTDPVASAAHLAALEIAKREPDLAASALQAAEVFRAGLVAEGVDVGCSACQIVSLELDSEIATAALYGRLRDQGILSSVFTHPAMPYGKGLVRFSFHTGLDLGRVAQAAVVVARTLDALAIPRGSV
ncbi:MAG TPA: aminotransferase class I/II-fold pyridoxal phosphate-dependent enzyme, partial [Myxococcota bacterium]|nr:aminotransferase class I/II-fold pyridoxal phosphate-dependent enzyme [Myxococcota bacterium]